MTACMRRFITWEWLHIHIIKPQSCQNWGVGGSTRGGT